MAKSVKEKQGTRAYRSPLRVDQARETRRRIREAADALFVEGGYVATSMDDVARQAGVSRQTVFSAFGTKARLLKEVLDVRLVGDDEPLSIEDRPDAQRMLASTDPLEAIRLQAKIAVDVAARVAPLWPVFAGVADTDPELVDLARFYDEGRLHGIGRIVDVVADLGALKKGRTRRRAKEAVWLLSSPATMAAALDRGWTAAEVERWFRECLVAVLVDADRIE
jgi:AcrR family transcriptional regulator